MGLFGKRSAPEPVPVDAPLSAHLAAIKRGDRSGVGGLVRAMLARDLWRAARELPPGMQPGVAYEVVEPITLSLADTTMPDGTRGLAVYSSAGTVALRHPEAVPLRMPGAQVLAPVLETDEYGGVVLDPGGPVVQLLAAQWVRDAAAGRL